MEKVRFKKEERDKILNNLYLYFFNLFYNVSNKNSCDVECVLLR